MQERKKRGPTLTRHTVLALFGTTTLKYFTLELNSFQEKVSKTNNNTGSLSVCKELPCVLLVWYNSTPSMLFMVAHFITHPCGF